VVKLILCISLGGVIGLIIHGLFTDGSEG
jgi:hypothetical protein